MSLLHLCFHCSPCQNSEYFSLGTIYNYFGPTIVICCLIICVLFEIVRKPFPILSLPLLFGSSQLLAQLRQLLLLLLLLMISETDQVEEKSLQRTPLTRNYFSLNFSFDFCRILVKLNIYVHFIYLVGTGN